MGGFDERAFQHALGGEAEDRLFALFALGYLAPAKITRYVEPFRGSSLEKERWASLIVLGRCHQEEALPSLVRLLQEGLVYASPLLQCTAQTSDAARRQAETLDEHYQLHYYWLTLHRLQVAVLLASWEDSCVIPALKQTFEICSDLEHSANDPAIPDMVRDDWYTFQDYLAYALGQQGAWDAPNGLALAFETLQIMRLFMAYGAIQASVSDVFSSGRVRLRAEQVRMVLQEHFHLTQEESQACYREGPAYVRRRSTSYKKGGVEAFSIACL